MSSEDTEAGTRVAVLFLETYWADRANGRRRSLADYLALFPGRESVVVREYLVAEGATQAVSPAARTTPETSGPPGEEQVGPYRIVNEIGRGGQGAVYLAEDTRLNRQVALKVLSSTSGVTPEASLRFHREASVASRLDHPGICPIYDVGRANGVSYIAMRYVPGESLAMLVAAAVEARGDCVGGDVPRIVSLIARAARALHVAHEASIIHRDVKPGNILVDRDGNPVILDFGIAREDSPSSVTLTQTGDIFGTPAYLAPEQIEGPSTRADRRVDVYALGVTLYECLTLRRPFEAPTRAALYQAISRGGPVDPRRLNPKISRDLAICVLTAIERDRDRRYQTAAALADDLEAILAGRPIAARPVGSLARLGRWAKREPAKATVAALLAVGLPVLGALGAYVYATRDSVAEAERGRTQRAIEGHLERGFLEMGEGSLAHARAEFDAALVLEPRSMEAAAGVVLSLINEDRKAEALAFLDRQPAELTAFPQMKEIRSEILEGRPGSRRAPDAAACPQDPVEAFVVGSRGLTEVHRGNWRAAAAALRAFETAIRHSMHARALYFMEAMHAAIHVGDPAAVERLTLALRTMWPDALMTRFYAASGVKITGKPEDALPLLESLARDRPDFSLGLISLGACYAGLARHEDAARAFSAAQALTPSPMGHRGLGYALFKSGKTDAALPELREAVRLSPREPQYRAALAEVLFASGDVEAGIAQYRESLKLGPEDETKIRHGFAARLERNGRLEEAIEEYRRLVERDPSYFTGWMNLGICLSKLNRNDEARRMFEKCLELSPGDGDALRNVGAIALGRAQELRDSGRLDEARLEAAEAARLRPDDAGCHFVLGTVRERLGDLAGAAEAYEAATRHQPDHAEAWCNLGLRLWELGRFTDAVPALGRGHELGTTRPSWKYPSGTWLETCQRLAAKNAAVEAVLRGESRPASLQAWIDLGQFCRRELGAAAEAGILAKAVSETDDVEIVRRLRFPAARAAARAASAAKDESRPSSRPTSNAERRGSIMRPLSAAQRSEWSRRAVAWLSDELTTIESDVAAGEMTSAQARPIVRRWLSDPELASLREPASNAKDEEPRRALWSRVDAFLAGE